MVVAEDLVARHDLPPFANSAMDGYAVRASDTGVASGEDPAALKIVGTIAAGHMSSVRLRSRGGAEDHDGCPDAGRRRRGGPGRDHQRDFGEVFVSEPVGAGNERPHGRGATCCPARQ